MPDFVCIHSLSISREKITTAGFNDLGSWLTLGCAKLGQLLVWEWRSESYILKLQGHYFDVNVVAYSPDLQLLATGADDNKIKVGYIVTSCLLNENRDFLRLVINSVRNDILGRNETFQFLAMTMVGNIGGREFAESLAPDVQKLLISSSCRPLVRKKAALCLLRLFRKNPDVVNVDGSHDTTFG